MILKKYFQRFQLQVLHYERFVSFHAFQNHMIALFSFMAVLTVKLSVVFLKACGLRISEIFVKNLSASKWPSHSSGWLHAIEWMEFSYTVLWVFNVQYLFLQFMSNKLKVVFTLVILTSTSNMSMWFTASHKCVKHEVNERFPWNERCF